MNGVREYNANQNKSVRERQIPYDFTHMYNLRNKWAKGTKERGKTLYGRVESLYCAPETNITLC